MKRYVTVSDLIMNGGEECTILRKEPHNEDYIIIETDDYNADHPDDLRIVSITYYNKETHVTEGLVWREIEDIDIDPENYEKYVLFVAADDLDNARMELFRRKICAGCWHYRDWDDSLNFRDWDKALIDPYNRCKCGGDNWDNYNAGKCPEKSPGCTEDIIKVLYTGEGRIIVLMKGDEEIYRSLPNESFKDFVNRIDLSRLS